MLARAGGGRQKRTEEGREGKRKGGERDRDREKEGERERTCRNTEKKDKEVDMGDISLLPDEARIEAPCLLVSRTITFLYSYLDSSKLSGLGFLQLISSPKFL